MAGVAACSTAVEEAPAVNREQAASQTATTEPPAAESAQTGLPDGPMIDMARLDGPAVQGYAEAYGITSERAAEIINWQAEITEQLGRVKSVAGPRYAGASFLPPGKNGSEAVVEVYIAEPTEEDYAAVAQLDRARLVEAIGGMEEIDRIAAAAAATARDEYPNAWISVAVDPATGEVDVSVDYPVLDD